MKPIPKPGPREPRPRKPLKSSGFLKRTESLPPVNRKRKAKRLAEGKVYGLTHRAYDAMPCFLEGLHECWLPVRGHHRKSVKNGGQDSDGEIPACIRAHAELHDCGEAYVEAKYGISLDEVQAQSLATLTLR